MASGASNPIATLPVRQREEEIKGLVRKHQTLVLTGETGSGKTTQLPQIVLDVLGKGCIAHTQPRRLAARSVAARIAEERGVPLGGEVGYKVRFDERTSRSTAIKVLTDGMLLAELASDPQLAAYNAVIIDEAHERSLNIDFLLGYLRGLLARRPDLKLIVTSATIEPRRFSDFFGGPAVAPVIEVSGRTFPVEVRHHPGAVDEDGEINADRVAEEADLLADSVGGGILVFLPGEREIRRCADALKRQNKSLEVLPLFSRLTNDEQDRIFHPVGTRPRVILATNIAETSLTVPGIMGVVDAGVERRSIYDAARKVQTLPVVPVSRASADQRKGRCGRVAAGVCVRLYSDKDYAARPAFTEPEIRRSNLAGVMLQMLSLGLPPIETFPFLDPPDARAIADGRETLFELGALTGREQSATLTDVGRKLARLPVDPRVGRMMLAGAEAGCLRPVTVLAAALSIQDPRERPMDRQRQADDAHSSFRDDTSDFMTLLNLWARYGEARAELGSGALQGWCREHFVNANRMREWAETAKQLLDIAVETFGEQPPATEREPDADDIHRALLPGLISNLACRESDGGSYDYRGVRGNVVNIFPGSALFKKNPKWIMAAEVVQTTRLYARTVAKVEPEWIEQLAGHMLERQLTDPHLDSETGEPSAWERATMNGIVVVPRRRVAIAATDPAKARELFIRDALVAGKFEGGGYIGRVRAAFAKARAIEAKLRRRDILKPDRDLIAWFERALPPSVVDPSTLAAWRAAEPCASSPAIGIPTPADLLATQANASDAMFPDKLALGEAGTTLDYLFKPGDERDGITATVEIADLPELSPQRAEWLVPGTLPDLILSLLKLLPTDRRQAIEKASPLAETAASVAELLLGADFGVKPFRDALTEAVEVVSGITIPPDAWNLKGRPAHLHLRVRVVDSSGKELAASRDLAELHERLASRVQRARAGRARARFDRTGVTAWDFGDLPDSVQADDSGGVPLHPALVDEGESCSITLVENAAEAAAMTRLGVRRLFAIACREQIGHELEALPNWHEMTQRYQALGSREVLLDGLTCLTVERVLLPQGQPLPRSAEEFESRKEANWGRLSAGVREVAGLMARTLEARQKVASRLASGTSRHWAASVADLREQAAYLLPRGFVLTTSWERFKELPRYAEGMRARLLALREDGSGPEKELLTKFAPYWKRFTAFVAAAMSEERRKAEAAPADEPPAGPKPEAPRKSKAPLPQARRAAPTVNLDAGEWAARPGKLPVHVERYRWALEEARLALFVEGGGGSGGGLAKLNEIWPA